jgi:hypothetical protein
MNCRSSNLTCFDEPEQTFNDHLEMLDQEIEAILAPI